MTTLAIFISALLLPGLLLGQPGVCRSRFSLSPHKSLAHAEKQNAAAVPFAGYLKEATVYRAKVVCDQRQELRTVIPLRSQVHQATRIQWRDLSKFPRLGKNQCEASIVFRVVAKETKKVAGQNQWRVTYHCQIIRIDAADFPIGV